MDKKPMTAKTVLPVCYGNDGRFWKNGMYSHNKLIYSSHLGQVLAPFPSWKVARGSWSLFSRLFFINQFPEVWHKVNAANPYIQMPMLDLSRK